jgi:hypothetical protein
VGRPGSGADREVRRRGGPVRRAPARTPREDQHGRSERREARAIARPGDGSPPELRLGSARQALLPADRASPRPARSRSRSRRPGSTSATC